MATNIRQPPAMAHAQMTPNDPASGAVKNTMPFASLKPANVLARMAFSDVFEAMKLGGQKPQDGGNVGLLWMVVEDEQSYDADVARFRAEEERGRETSESLTEPDTDAEASGGSGLGMMWAGRYMFALKPKPSNTDLGWTAGKGTTEQAPCSDLVLSTKAFAKQYGISLRTFHARFSFVHDTAAFFVARVTRSSRAELAVNGEPVERQMHALNQQGMRIRLGSLEYILEYTGFATTDEFKENRRRYIAEVLGGPATSPFDMPTPRQETRTIGQWTLSDPLGKGAEGRVFLASNARNDVVAIKVIERNPRTAGRINAEIAMYREVTDLANDDDDGRRIVRLKEIIYPGGEEKFSTGSVFDQVGLVLEPMTPGTLAGAISNANKGYKRGMSLQSAALFHDALRGLRFLHAHGWVHGDIKPQNIGVLTHPTRAVLLDLGQMAKLAPGAKLKATPGCGGTVNYLSPEREMDEYDHGIDIWPMGVIGYELTYGLHLFKFAANPWRRGTEYERLRPTWQDRYEKAIAQLSADHEQLSAQEGAGKDQGYIHFGDVLARMMRQRWARHNSGRRISIDEALEHDVWEEATRPVKRGRTGGADACP